MTDFYSLRSEIIRLGESTVHAMEAQNRLADAHGNELAKLWADNAELRDELHALANRVEALTRARLGNFCGRLGCNFSEPHRHDPDDGHIIIDHAGPVPWPRTLPVPDNG